MSSALDLEAQNRTMRHCSPTTESSTVPEPMNQTQTRRKTSGTASAHEESAIYWFEESLRNEEPSAEPCFLEMRRLRRLHFLYINKRLASYRKQLLEKRRMSDDDLSNLGRLLHEQIEAIEDYRYMRSLDYLSTDQKDIRRKKFEKHFSQTGKSVIEGVFPFESENYRCLNLSDTGPRNDDLREWLRTHLWVRISWSNQEKRANNEAYQDGLAPRKLSDNAERLARFLVAMVGALFLLAPMYIMSIDQSLTKNLLTTTAAVLLFATTCSITLRTTNDQTLGATAGYAAVLVVFVGLTLDNSEPIAPVCTCNLAA